MTNQQYEECIRACLECLEACNTCFTSCLKEEHIDMMRECIKLDRECADICSFAVTAMQTDSLHLREICALCAQICKACAEECSKHEQVHCQKCANACRNCVDARKNGCVREDHNAVVLNYSEKAMVTNGFFILV